MSMASFVLALSMMLSSGAVGFRRLFMVLSGHVVLIFWHYFTSPFEIDRVNMNLILCPGVLLGQSGALYGSTPCTTLDLLEALKQNGIPVVIMAGDNHGDPDYIPLLR